MAYRFLKTSVLGASVSVGPYKIIGGGVAGLFIGYNMKRSGKDFQIVESSERAGGLIKTEITDFGNAEAAANGFIWSIELEEIAETVGIKIMPPAPASRKKYIFFNKKLKSIPLNIGEMAQALWNVAIPKKVEPVTVRDFSDRYLSSAISSRILNPAMGGIYAADIKDLSFPGTMPEIAKMQQKGRSLLFNYLFKKDKGDNKKIAGTHSFLRGMGQLATGLSNYLKEEIKLYADGKKFIGSRNELILSVPAYVAADFFPEHQLGELLKAVKYIPVLSVKVFFAEDAIDELKHGFGCVIPGSEGLNSIGILFNHDIFPEHVEDGFLSFTCILRDDYENGKRSFIDMDDKEIEEMVFNEMKHIFHIKKGPEKVVVHRYERGIPLYSPEHYENLFLMDELLKKDFPNIRLFGNYTGQISIRGMAKEAAAWTKANL